MKLRQYLIPVLGLLAAMGCRETPHVEMEAERVFAFVDVNVVPMDREVIFSHYTVIVQGERIVDVGPSDETLVPDDAEHIDGQDAYLMPGLVDMHVHPADPDELLLFVANGVTTIRNMWGFAEEHLVWRGQVDKGEIVGPSIYTTGPLLDGNPPMIPGSEVVETPDAAAQAVAAHKDAGYDFIKVLSYPTSEVYDAIVAAAAVHEIKVVGHVPFSVALDHALSTGISSIEHLTGYEFSLQRDDSPVVDPSEKGASRQAWKYFDESKLREVVEKTVQTGVWNCPTLEVFGAHLPENMELLRKRGELKYVSASMRHWWDADLNRPGREEAVALDRTSMDGRKKVVRALSAGGAWLLLGTDAGSTGVLPGFSAHRELQNLVGSGLTPYEAIRAGTADAARFLDAKDDFGTVSVGRRGDLLLVEGNPLNDVANTARIVGVMLRGKWFRKTDLLGMLDDVAASYERQRQAAENPK